MDCYSLIDNSMTLSNRRLSGWGIPLQRDGWLNWSIRSAYRFFRSNSHRYSERLKEGVPIFAKIRLFIYAAIFRDYWTLGLRFKYILLVYSFFLSVATGEFIQPWNSRSERFLMHGRIRLESALGQESVLWWITANFLVRVENLIESLPKIIPKGEVIIESGHKKVFMLSKVDW